MGALVADPKWLPLLFLLPALIFAAVAFWAPKPVPAPPFEFGSVFPASVLEPLFFAISGFALLAFAVGVVRFARGIGETPSAGFGAALKDIAAHQSFKQCDDASMRLAHQLTMWGFAGLAMVGTATGIGTMAGVLRTPLALESPLKIFANLAAAASLAGVTLLLARRVGRPASTYFDWFFLAALSGVVFTGIAAELLRLAEARAMYGVYFVHLVLIFGLLLYAPYSKFAHLAYRTVAMARSRKFNARS